MLEFQRAVSEFLAVKRNRLALAAVLGLAEVCLIAGMLTLLGLLSGRLPNPQALLAPRQPLPTPACLQPSLLLGSASFAVESLPTPEVGSITLPAAADRVYRVAGSGPGYVFALNPSPQALALVTTLKSGDGLRIIWADCSMEDFTVQFVTPGEPALDALLDQSAPGVRVFVPISPGQTGFIVQAARETAAPTAACGSPALRIGEARYPIHEISAGALALPADPNAVARVAYHIAGTQAYALPPSADNLALGSVLKAGDLVSILDSGCAASDYVIEAPQTGVVYTPSADDPTPLVIFTQGAPQGQGFVLRAAPVSAEVISIAAPELDSAEVQVEISLLETTTPDAATLRVRIAIYNFGAAPAVLAPKDVQLLPLEAGPFLANSSDPALPFEIGPGATQAVTLTFPRPQSAGALLSIFGVEYALEGY